MRLVLLTNVFPNALSPTKGTFNLEMVKSLNSGHEVTVVSPIAWTDELQAWSRHQARIPTGREARIGNIRTLYPRFWYPPRIARDRYDRFLHWSIERTLNKVAKEINPDVVLGYWAHPDGAVAVRWARMLSVPGWIMVGGSDVLLLTRNKQRCRAIQQSLNEATGVIAVSNDIAHQLRLLGVPHGKIHVVYRGIDRVRFSSGDKAAARRHLGLHPSKKTLVWVGRMVEVKGLNILLDAAARLHANGDDFQLCLVGDGPQRAALERQVSTAGLRDRVRFVGVCPHAELPQWYQAADWTVLSSLSEGVPNVLLESHACGTPFVAMAVGGVPEIAVDGIDMIVPPGAAEALAKALGNAQCKTSSGIDEVMAKVPSMESFTQQISELLGGRSAGPSEGKCGTRMICGESVR